MQIKLEKEEDLDLTIGEIKEKYLGIPTNFLGTQLVFRGKLLRNDMTLREVNFNWKKDVLFDLTIMAGSENNSSLK